MNITPADPPGSLAEGWINGARGLIYKRKMGKRFNHPTDKRPSETIDIYACTRELVCCKELYGRRRCGIVGKASEKRAESLGNFRH